jgi:molybdate/tungstate transport system permease protein
MTLRRNQAFVIFGILGGLLLLGLTLPILNLLWRSEWRTAWRSVTQPPALAAMRVSLLSSTIAMLVMTVLGIPLGYLLAHGKLPMKRLWIGLVFLPMVVPDLAGGILLLRLFGPYGAIGRVFDARDVAIVGNLAGIILVQIFVAAPFVVIAALAAFSSVDRELESAAGTLGDSTWQIFWRISLPLAWPGIIAGVTMAWIRALGEFGATMIMAYNPHTLPVFLWVRFETEGLAGAMPIALCLVLIAALAVTVSMNLSRFMGLADALAPLGKTTKWEN